MLSEVDTKHATTDFNCNMYWLSNTAWYARAPVLCDCPSIHPCAAVLTPLEYVAYEGGPGVTLHCTLTTPGTSTVGTLEIWVDGRELSTEEQHQRGIEISSPQKLSSTTYYRTATVSASQANRNTDIQCFGFGYGLTNGFASSDMATFMVQGNAVLNANCIL